MTTATPQPYGLAARLYLQKGWAGVLPLPANEKTPPPTGYTGGGADPTVEQVEAWLANGHAGGNIALRLPADVLGIDVDAYAGKAGAESLAEAEARFGELPPTWTCTSRSDGVSGIRFFTVPEGLAWPNTVGPGIETIRRGHRYAVVFPSVHPSGATYRWLDRDGQVCEPPRPVDLPELPDAWVIGLTQGAMDTGPVRRVVVTADEGHEALTSWLTPGTCIRVEQVLSRALVALDGPAGSRHDYTRDYMLRLLSMGQSGHGAVGYAMAQLENAFMDVISVERGGSSAQSEWRRMLEGAVEIMLATEEVEEDCGGEHCGKARSLLDLGLVQPGGPAAALSGPLAAPGQLQSPEAPGSPWADLSWLLTGSAPEPPVPAVLQRSDGASLFYDGRVNGIFGDPETAKSWVAMCAVVECLQADGRAVYLDVDHNGSAEVASRLLRLGAPVEALADPDWFRVYEPESGIELVQFTTEMLAWRPGVAVIDSLGEVLPMLGVSSKDNDDITRALRAVVKPLAHTAGACVIVVDHLPKSEEGRSSGYAIGGTAKKRSVDGSYLKAEARTPPAPGSTGRVSLFIEKDRHGGLRRTSKGSLAGTFVMVSPDNDDEPIEWSVEVSAGAMFNGERTPELPFSDMGRVMEWLFANNGTGSLTAIREGIGMKKASVTAAVGHLEQRGHVRVEAGPRGAKVVTYVTPFIPATDHPFPPVPDPFPPVPGNGSEGGVTRSQERTPPPSRGEAPGGTGGTVATGTTSGAEDQGSPVPEPEAALQAVLDGLGGEVVP